MINHISTTTTNKKSNNFMEAQNYNCATFIKRACFMFHKGYHQPSMKEEINTEHK